MQKITPVIRCVANAKELADYYLATFPESKLVEETPMFIEIEIFGRHIAFLNGGEHATPNPSISFSLWIKDKDLTKTLWDTLSDGGEVLMPYADYDWSEGYGRCNDTFGVSRQVMYDNREKTGHHQLIPSFLFTGGVNGKAQEAMDFYTDIFPASKVVSTRPYAADAGDIEGNLAHAEFALVNRLFIATDSSGPHNFSFDDGVSLMVSCKDQEEIDYYWEKLILDGGKEVQCGWGKDRFGVSRQIIPVGLGKMLQKPGAMEKMLQMKKLIVSDLVD